MSTKRLIAAIRQSLSPARMSTFEAATAPVAEDDPSAVALYAWNARISAALLFPLHLCEVVVRNAVAEAIESVYGPMWPWSSGFIRSLPIVKGGYDPVRDLTSACKGVSTTGKVIAELKFVFWQKIFTSRFEPRLWDPFLRQVFPNLDSSRTISELRQEIYDDLEEIRKLRNRIAHHEPIFNRDPARAIARITTLVGYRCRITATWMSSNEQASLLLREQPAFQFGPRPEDIERLAYELWIKRGNRQGSSDEDWLQAERELRGT